MVEGSFRSVDPLAYHVNTLSDLDPHIVTAYKKKDHEKIKVLVDMGRMDMDIFICANKNWHGFVLCAPAGDAEDGLPDIFSDVIKSPFDIPSQLMCWQYELCFDNEQLHMYKIRKQCQLFADIKPKISRGYYIGNFKGTSLNALQFAALRAAPHRYGVLLNDCVAFAKEFCVQALAYCSNWRDIEKQVDDNIAKASASGFSVEKLSRNVRSSGWLGNTFLGGTDISSWMSGRHTVLAVVAFFLFSVVCNAIVTVILVKVLK